MIYNSLRDHADAIRSTVKLINDATFPEPTRAGARRYLNILLNDYEFIDNKLNGGYAIRVNRSDRITLH